MVGAMTADVLGTDYVNDLSVGEASSVESNQAALEAAMAVVFRSVHPELRDDDLMPAIKAAWRTVVSGRVAGVCAAIPGGARRAAFRRVTDTLVRELPPWAALEVLAFVRGGFRRGLSKDQPRRSTAHL
jgi:hypothetical protein